MHRFFGLTLALFFALAGCGSSDGGSCFSNTGPDSQLCVDCYTVACANQLTACYGADWPKDNLSSGTCSDYGTCITSCGCGNPSCPEKVCNQACLFSCDSPTTDCQSCLDTITACRTQECGTSCK